MRVALNGYIVSDDVVELYRFFGYSVFSPATIRKAIEENPEGEDLILEVNSAGGSVIPGFEMFTVLKSAPITTIAEVQSIAASAASTMIAGCTKVYVSPVAQIMMHLPLTSTYGNENAHKTSLRILKSFKESILNGYETKCRGKTARAQLEAMMNSETWLTAQQAVEIGLADGILYQDDGFVLPNSIVNAVGGGIRSLINSGTGLPDPEQLRAEYNRLKAKEQPVVLGEGKTCDTAAEKAAEDNDGWRARARAWLNIEKLRF